MKIGLLDSCPTNFPNLPLMKISAYHKSLGDEVSFVNFLEHYDIVYVSRIFGDEYFPEDLTAINSDRIIYGGTGGGQSLSKMGLKSTTKTKTRFFRTKLSIYTQTTTCIQN